MRRCLVTGGTGFIGTNLVRRLLADGHEVDLLVRPQHQTWRIKDILSDVRLHKVDLTDAARLKFILRKIKPEWIFHLAAYGAYSFQRSFSRMLEINLQGTINLVEAGINSGFAAFVNVGSSSEYGFKDHAPKEDEAVVPNSHYAVTKACATLYCQHQAIGKKAKIVTLRPYSVYGPFEEPTRLLPTLIVKGLQGKLPLLTDPAVARDYIYVDDFVDACLLVAHRKAAEEAAIYNVSTGVQTSLKELVALTRRYLPIQEKPKWGSMKNRSWDTNIWVGDSRKIHKAFGWSPRHTLTQGFQKMVQWFNSHPEMFEFCSATVKKNNHS